MRKKQKRQLSYSLSCQARVYEEAALSFAALFGISRLPTGQRVCNAGYAQSGVLDLINLDTAMRPILYSAVSKVSVAINREFYGDLHFMWCSPYFGCEFNRPTFDNPPSSSPIEVYRLLKKETEGFDGHSQKILAVRIGLKSGADKMLMREKISYAQRDAIHTIADRVPDAQFQPLMCVVPLAEAKKHYQTTMIEDRANPLSHEYVVADLPGSGFDIVRIDL